VTPLEALIQQSIVALDQHHREVDAWAERKTREIHAAAVWCSRSIGQRGRREREREPAVRAFKRAQLALSLI
jgi:hypothetical protein